MPRLPVVSGQEAVRAFERAGFQARRQRGSHIVMTKLGYPQTLSIPQHPTLSPGTLRALVRKAGLTVDEFLDLLR